MTQSTRAPLEQLIGGFDRALRTLSGVQQAARPTPAASAAAEVMSDTDRAHAAGLMRVNHTGEICAQALYDGQALTARSGAVREQLESAAAEEADHLVWCAQRLEQLDSQPSVLNPLFYAGSYVMGAVTGLLGDRLSLGFVEATEAQVCEHLAEHLEALPDDDAPSRAIIEQMQEDEARHGDQALAAGGTEFPAPVKRAMSLVAKIMTTTTYRI